MSQAVPRVTANMFIYQFFHFFIFFSLFWRRMKIQLSFWFSRLTCNLWPVTCDLSTVWLECPRWHRSLQKNTYWCVWFMTCGLWPTVLQSRTLYWDVPEKNCHFLHFSVWRFSFDDVWRYDFFRGWGHFCLAVLVRFCDIVVCGKCVFVIFEDFWLWLWLWQWHLTVSGHFLTWAFFCSTVTAHSSRHPPAKALLFVYIFLDFIYHTDGRGVRTRNVDAK